MDEGDADLVRAVETYVRDTGLLLQHRSRSAGTQALGRNLVGYADAIAAEVRMVSRLVVDLPAMRGARDLAASVDTESWSQLK